MPAVKLAEEGFIMHAGLAGSLNGTVRRYAEQIPELARVYGKDGGESEWQGGDRLILKDLGRTLRMIAEDGPDAFYLGEIADLLVAEMERSGGLITKADLRDYEAKIREPIHATFRGYDIYGPPPPSSGGICLAMMLNILENFDLKAQGRYSTKTMHQIIEAMRRAYSDRAKYLGDQDFVDIPSHLTTKEYAVELVAGIDLEKATRSEDLAPPIKLATEGVETTHFSVVDSTGMMVSNTYTLEQGYGSKVVVGGAGFLLNNEMGDFNRNPGVTNTRGGIGTVPNLIEPGKRMLSSMTPIVVTKDGVPVLVTGSPGGRTIINTVLCVTLNVLEFDMNIRDAVDAPRMDHEWFPNRIRFMGADDTEHQAMIEALRAMGHDISASRGQGDANSIQIINGVFYGAADASRGKASGY
jgi:gamma-glutamyltranspeptidase/glutathione hydrolase